MSVELYEELGRTYRDARRTDPRIARFVEAAIGDATSVVNVGAGTGSYEPRDRSVVAVEPSAAMRARRPATAAPCIRGHAEALPFDDASVDVALAVYTDFHWSDRARGIAEMRRVARRAVVILTVDAAASERYWLIRDYIPEGRTLFRDVEELRDLLPGAEVRPVPVPADCEDGFVQAFWRRPRALLDPGVRSSMALFGRMSDDAVEAAMARLAADLDDGTWDRRNADLLDAPSADVGHRIVVWRRPA